MMPASRLIASLLSLLALLLVMPSCQQDQRVDIGGYRHRSTTQVGEDGSETSFQVLNADGQNIPNVKIYETVSAASGSVYQFSRGEGNFNFEAGPKYKLRSEGYHDLEFTIDGMDHLTRVVFYLWRSEASHEGLSVSGQVRASNFRMFQGVQVACGGEQIISGDDGAFFFQPVLDEEGSKPLPLAYTWPITASEQGELRLELLNRPDFPVRLDVYLDTETVLAPKQKATN
ncbi:MAG: hypothetical protein R2787_15595 [Saprospiraceae bacterium]